MEPPAARGRVAHTVRLLVSEVAPINAELQRLWAIVAAGPGAGEQALYFRPLSRYSSVCSATCISQKAAPPTSSAESGHGSPSLRPRKPGPCPSPQRHLSAGCGSQPPCEPTAPAGLWDDAHPGGATTRPGFGRRLCWSTSEDARKGGVWEDPRALMTLAETA